ncbi:hypothetical protein D0869_00435 [Hortaea werneckii]|uniref:Enoyl-CoA hydratase n=1 Tax=Hortaea werneckii TaxID=91943 RepID=A0A3M6XGQ7_HORWE|nr:hypothetical protein D0869_00435 [Hortaea werneckii]
MGADIKQLQLPTSYSALPTKEIRFHHVPEASQDVTPIIVIELYRPNKYNAFTEQMMRELEHAFQLVDVDDRVKCAVVTGNGRMFCAGADLDTAFKGGQEDPRDHRDGGGRVALAIHRCRKPVIGALQGSAVGIGITMTLPMNIRIAYKDAKIGMSKALHLTTTGSTYPASHALLNDLFSETLDRPDAVLPRALEIADEIVKNTSSVSTCLMKDLMYRDAGSAEGQHLLDSRLIYEMFSSKDNKEGVDAFLQKRPVKFTGTMQRDAPAAWPWYQAADTGNRVVAEGGRKLPKL